MWISKKQKTLVLQTMRDDKSDFKKQSITFTIGSIIVSAINGIVGFIAVYFFKPLWEKIISKLRK
jgi:hypothetical protein